MLKISKQGSGCGAIGGEVICDTRIQSSVISFITFINRNHQERRKLTKKRPGTDHSKKDSENSSLFPLIRNSFTLHESNDGFSWPPFEINANMFLNYYIQIQYFNVDQPLCISLPAYLFYCSSTTTCSSGQPWFLIYRSATG